MTVRRWDIVRKFALHLPAAAEDFPWGEAVIKVERRDVAPPSWRRGLVHGPMFLWLGRRDVKSHVVHVKLTSCYDQAVEMAGAVRTAASGLGQWGWLTVALGSVDVDLMCDWVEESYRNIAPKNLVAQLDGVAPRRR
jgi:predicted DNA-binding protein (MmcQ/YjbR family)